MLLVRTFCFDVSIQNLHIIRFVRHGITGLTIPEVLPKDAGLYICQLSEIGGSTYPIVAGCVIIHGQLHV